MIGTDQNGLVVHLEQPRRLQAEDFLHLEAVFNFLPKVLLCIKDYSRRWVTCNRVALSLLCKQDQIEVLGALEEDFSRRPSSKPSKKMICGYWITAGVSLENGVAGIVNDMMDVEPTSETLDPSHPVEATIR